VPFADGRLSVIGGAVVVRDAATGRERFRLLDDAALVWFMQFSSDGRSLAVREWGGRLTVWDVDTGQLRCSFPSAALSPPNSKAMGLEPIKFSPDGRYLAFRGLDPGAM